MSDAANSNASAGNEPASDAPAFELQHCLMPEADVLPLLQGRQQRSAGRVMDPKAQVVAEFSRSVRVPGYFPPLPELRQQIRTLVQLLDEPAPALKRIEDISVPGADGPLAARVYTDSDAPSQPVLAFFHGGGWVQGDLESHHGLCAHFAKWSGAMVVAVDYRLAPETKFPGGLNDCLAAYGWLRQHAAEIGGDPARVAVGGDSAGGNLSIVVAQRAAAADLPVPDFQWLIYPATDFGMTAASHDEFVEGAIIPRDRVIWYRDQYLASPDDAGDLRASPLLTKDLQGQPPALIQTAGFDPLRDEGLDYANRLRDAGVHTVHHEYPGQIHGFMMLTKAIPEGLVAIREGADYARRHWGL